MKNILKNVNYHQKYIIIQGEQIFNDYDLHEEEMAVPIDPCCCGSIKCRGAVKGFNHIPFLQQRQMLRWVDDKIKQQWLKLHPDVNVESV